MDAQVMNPGPDLSGVLIWLARRDLGRSAS
jgi:hypothetical protein